MAWRFVPTQTDERVHLGQASMAFFEAENLSDHPIVGHATFNVTPDKAGIYFKKIQCFCFEEERLAPHQRVEMPVTFYVDKRLGTDPSTTDVTDITLSYTFFISRNPAAAADLARFADAPPDAGAGQTLFAEHCAGCHVRAHEAPSLTGVFGRPAAKPVLSLFGLSRPRPPHLDRGQPRHLAARPAGRHPRRRMGLKVPGAQARRDIIAYLRTLKEDRGSAPSPAKG